MGTEDELLAALGKLRGSQTVIVGIGNTLKGDDGAGPLACEGLEGEVCAELIDAGTVPENYIQTIIKKAPTNLLVIDAIDFGAVPGKVKVFGPEQLRSVAVSTHVLSARLFVDMIRGDIDVDVHFIGIQPAQRQLGQRLSEEVKEAIQALRRALVELFPAR